MYVRFVLGQAFLEGRHRAGILRDSVRCRFWRRRCVARADEILEIFAWLNAHLPLPPVDVFSGGRGLCWFRSESGTCVERVRTLALLYRTQGARIWEIGNRNPGLITYQDDYQIVALPDSLRLAEPAGSP
jgi:hypothetical protein